MIGWKLCDELKTPISSILSYCETLLDENQEKDDIKKSFESVVGKDEVIQKLINESAPIIMKIKKARYIIENVCSSYSVVLLIDTFYVEIKQHFFLCWLHYYPTI